MSFFRYPGGKSKLRIHIVSRLEQLCTSDIIQYCEPFFGGGSIGLHFLAQNPISSIWINDKDIALAALWTSVIQYPDDLKSKVLAFKPSVDQFYSIRKELLTTDVAPKQRNKIIELGFKKLAIHQISYSGLGTKSGGPLGGEKQASAYKIDCRWSPEYICKKIDKLHSTFSQLDVFDNSCTNLDFASLIENEDKKSLLYLDPPYFVKGDDLYQCKFSKRDHLRLADALKATKHNWLLSYDDCLETRSMYSWAKIEVVDVNYSITALKNVETGERLARSKQELLISKL